MNRQDTLHFLGKYGTILALGIMVVSFGLFLPTFRSKENHTNMMEQIAFLAIISAGLTSCLKAGDFDLSIGGVATLAGNVVAWLLVNDYGMALSIFGALSIGIAAGALNALLVAYIGFHSLICTLATMGIFMGLTEGLTRGISIWSGIPENFSFMSKGELGGIPVRFIIMFLLLLFLEFLHRQTEMGRRMEAIGGNPQASKLSGIDVRWNRLLAFATSGFFASITGVLVTSSLMSSDANIGIGFTFPAIVACFIGAATVRIGHFHILGTLIGVLIAVVATNSLIVLLVPGYLMDMVRAMILLLAILLASLTARESSQ
jgi:ribose transport system permease protein